MKILPVSNTHIFCVNTHKNRNQTQSTIQRNDGTLPSSSFRANFMPVFTSLTRKDKYTGTPLNSGFYRDIPTLLSAVSILDKTFSDGTDIIVGACSTGEELISLYSLMPKGERYRFIGLDISKDALDIAQNKNIYSICPNYGDDFLLEQSKDKVLKLLTSCFWNVMEKTDKPDFKLNEPVFKFGFGDQNAADDNDEIYCRVKDSHRKNLNFDECDIKKINEFETDKKAGAIFFRNALYLLTGNYLSNGILDAKEGHNIYFNKSKCLSSVVDAVYDKLDNGGIFVLGDIVADHIYLADKFTPRKDKLKIDDVPMFNDDIDYYMADPDTEIYKESPLYAALKRDDRFRPLFYSNLTRNSYSQDVPTIWQKNK